MSICSLPSLRMMLVLLVAAAAGQTYGNDVMNPARRHEAIDRAKQLLAPRELPAATIDPFHSQAFYEMVAGVAAPVVGEAPPAGPRTDRELLQALAASLKPSGYFVLGGEPTLVFGQKRVKAGGTLTITFEGNEYILEVTDVDRTHFTLRLNREEFIRPIK